MATAGDVITRALQLNGIHGPGKVPNDDDFATGLASLNSLVDSWRNDKLMCWAERVESITLAAGTSTYTVGPGGTLNTDRPVEIDGAYITQGATSYPILRQLSEQEYAAIGLKGATSSWPEAILFRPDYPLASIIVYPVPTMTTTLNIITRKPFTGFSSITDNVALPPGWQKALEFNLAIDLAPMWQTQPPPLVMKGAVESLKGIKNSNLFAHPNRVDIDLGPMFTPRRQNIITGV